MNQQAVIYVRVSSKEQKQEGYSIPAQKRLLWDFAKAKGFKVAKVFEDDETAKSAGRAGFGEMVEFIKSNKKIEIILVEKTDRLYRNFKDYVIIDELGISVFLVKENEVLGKNASSHQKFIHGIKVLMAKNYIDNLSEEVKKGLQQKADSGICPTSNPSLGYRLEKTEGKSTQVIDEVNKTLVMSLFEYYATGLYSIKSLMQRVKDERLIIPANFPKSSKLKTLTKSSVHRILRNPFYYGNFYWKGKVYKGTHQPLINRELWDKVQEILDKQNNKPIPKYNTLTFAFKGILNCGECGRTITAIRKTKPSGNKYVYYYCTKFETNCSQKPASETTLNGQIMKQLDVLEKIPDDTVPYVAEGLRRSLYAKRETEDKTKEKLEVEKKKYENRLGVLYEDKLDRIIDEDFYNKKSAEYEAKIKELDQQISKRTLADIDYYKFGSKILELAKRASFLYENGNDKEKQELLNFLLLNSSLRDEKLCISYKKPFDKVYQRALCSDWRARPDLNRRSSP